CDDPRRHLGRRRALAGADRLADLRPGGDCRGRGRGGGGSSGRLVPAVPQEAGAGRTASGGRIGSTTGSASSSSASGAVAAGSTPWRPKAWGEVGYGSKLSGPFASRR